MTTATRLDLTDVDQREPRYRRETFLRFYEFHIRYRAHPGGVYYLLPALAEHFGWTEEQALWFAVLNGNTQHPVTSLLLFEQGPTPRPASVSAIVAFWAKHYARLAFDTDRRYHKRQLPAALWGLLGVSGGDPTSYWRRAAAGGFAAMWAAATAIPTFGRLSAFSFTEYLRIMGLDFDCDTLMLDDIDGSRSHRNGLAIVTGRDEYDWHASNPGFDGRYPPDLLEELASAGESLLAEARARMPGERDVSYFTLESALCTYKSWHRPNRRYPNVYNDMLHDRLIHAHHSWPSLDLSPFWVARGHALPPHLRLEDTPHDPGLSPLKQNWYRETGRAPMMHRDWTDLGCELNDRIDARAIGPFR